MPLKDYYRILGISQGAPIEQVRQAYRRLAIKTHPDKKGDEKKFLEYTEAYEVLQDREKRSAYDTLIKPRKPKSFRKGADLRIDLQVYLSELIRGVAKRITIQRKSPCIDCGATGSREKLIRTCPTCWGVGVDPVSMVLKSRNPCSYCKGAGHLPEGELCNTCNGAGLNMETVTHEIQLSMKSQNRIVIAKAGNYVYGGSEKESGDLIIDLIILKDPIYSIRGNNLYRILEIMPSQAIVGDIIEIDVFGESLEINIQPGTQHGQVLEYKGIKWIKGKFQIRIEIKIPENITQEERCLHKKILELNRKHQNSPIKR